MSAVIGIFEYFGSLLPDGPVGVKYESARFWGPAPSSSRVPKYSKMPITAEMNAIAEK